MKNKIKYADVFCGCCVGVCCVCVCVLYVFCESRLVGPHGLNLIKFGQLRTVCV
jgi:hypothetical protein